MQKLKIFSNNIKKTINILKLKILLIILISINLIKSKKQL